MRNKANKVSLGSIALRAGVSTSTVSLALQNKKVVNAQTRERILRIAGELGYAPDARLSKLMAGVRETKEKDLLPIAWLNTSWERESWQQFPFHTPFIEGARVRALELGYKIEDIWVHEDGMTMQRLSKILYQRGIEGVIVTHPAVHIRLKWDHLAAVSLGGALMAPKLYRIMPDFNFNLQLALKWVRRHGYQRIGICLMRSVDRASQYSIRAAASDLYFSASREERIPPLFHTALTYYEMKEMKEKVQETFESEFIAWVRKYKPEVVVGHDGRLKEWVEKAGYRVPEDVGVVHLAVDDDVLDWAGIHSRRRDIGATAVDELVSLMRNRQYGVPKVPLNILVRGSWHPGNTILSRKKVTPVGDRR